MQASNEQIAIRAPTSRKVILMVEDDGGNATMLAQVLSQETPHHVFLARTSSAALNFVKHIRPDLFLFDYRLPEMNGIQLYDHLHADRELENIPAIIISATLEDYEEDIEKRQLIGFSKPFNLDDFLFTIEKALSRSSECSSP